MKRLFAAALVLAVFFCACTKEDASTTAKLSYSFKQLNASSTVGTEASSGTPIAAGSNGSINWTSVTVNISKVEFSANHAGATTSLESKNIYGVNPLKTDSLSGTVTIPSGVYENLRFKLTMNESTANPPVVLSGVYTETSGTKIPVTVTLNSVLSFVKEASRIEVAPGDYVAAVTIELNALVKGLTASDFGQTTRTGATNAIVVNYNTNRALYEKLLARVANTMSVSVSKK